MDMGRIDGRGCSRSFHAHLAAIMLQNVLMTHENTFGWSYQVGANMGKSTRPVYRGHTVITGHTVV